MARKLFDGKSLADIAAQAKERTESTASSPSLARLTAVDMAMGSAPRAAAERELIFTVDPNRCRPWKYHNRTDDWYTPENCADLIASISKEGQQQPALARKIEGEADFDYEIIYGMRRRFACAYLGRKLRIRVINNLDDAKASVLMHLENFHRKDITPMERALSFRTQLKAGVFSSQEAMCEVLGVSAPHMTKMLKAASLLEHSAIEALFPKKREVPVELAYKVATLMERQGAKEIILQRARSIAKTDASKHTPSSILKSLAKSLETTKLLPPMQKAYNLGDSKQVVVSRNPKGKVTLNFPKGLEGVPAETVLDTVRKILTELGDASFRDETP